MGGVYLLRFVGGASINNHTMYMYFNGSTYVAIDRDLV